MKKPLFSFLLVFLLFETFLNALVVSEDYPIPGSDYNNIGVKAEVIIDLNVTLVNTAQYPKFVVINPRYDFIVHREDNSEFYYATQEDNRTVYYLNSLAKNTLNYFMGFWVNPHETVTVEFRIPINNTYVMSLSDYSLISCPDNKITEIKYENASISGFVNTGEDISKLFCGVMYPQLLNSPMIIDVVSLLHLTDGHIKVLEYKGEVTFRLTNIPDKFGDFRTMFAVSLPVIFKDAYHYSFTPHYTMMYEEYRNEFLPEYIGIAPIKRTIKNNVISTKFSLYSLSNTLLTGKKIETPQQPKSSLVGLNYPVWIVWLGSTPLEIKYHVAWDNSGKVSTVGGQKEEAFRFILDRGDFK